MSVRTAVYGVTTAVLALLVALGVITDGTSTSLAGLAAAGIAFVTETVKAGGLSALLRSEPVRTAAYGVALPVLALLVQSGVIDDATSGTLAAVAGVVLLGATEAARSIVTPVAKMVREQRLS